ncbi:hypothetical protein GCM10023149_48670 [Mucilaginibacter gynuensis]|uniref:ParB-like N-terminal domain-containing protein n=1 Tax=Mucilaginibacter gynuensis TaxID=1302236 RepID=A0ABP8HFJ9_9SPHI
MQVKYRNVSSISLLEGNPRSIKEKEFKSLCESIKSNPEYFEARPVILSDRTGKLVAIAGNMRMRAAQHIGLSKVPTVLMSGLTEEKEREIIIRDNVSNGSWDFDILANEWDKNQLFEWGVDLKLETKDAAKKSVVRMSIEFTSLKDYDEAKLEIQNLINDYFPTAKIRK